jgi:hypothetical protein
MQGTNRFQYFGNGHSCAEQDGDLSYYIRNHDDSYVDPVLKSKVAPPIKTADKIATSGIGGLDASHADPVMSGSVLQSISVSD